MSIEIDGRLVKHFLWNSLAEAYKGKGDDDYTTKVYETVIKEYEAALEKRGNDLMWHYTGNSIYGVDEVFGRKQELSEPVLWSALGEVCKAKGDTDKAVYAFRKALEKERDNVWLQSVLCELGMVETEVNETIEKSPDMALDSRQQVGTRRVGKRGLKRKEQTEEQEPSFRERRKTGKIVM